MENERNWRNKSLENRSKRLGKKGKGYPTEPLATQKEPEQRRCEGIVGKTRPHWARSHMFTKRKTVCDSCIMNGI